MALFNKVLKEKLMQRYNSSGPLVPVDAVARPAGGVSRGSSVGPPPESFAPDLQGLARQLFGSNAQLSVRQGIAEPLAGVARPAGVSPQVWRRFVSGKASRKEEANVWRKRGMQ